ncbi:MAG: RnfABCDGE type electron transport complex subunit D [Oscillospiraceae bacterium]|nr:RnfABCDGE type electron transport complex subunit D [Oscillospiraceae bacterium]
MKHFYETAISSSPHIRSKDNTQTIMRDVVVALLPALAGACYFFGFRALVLAVVSCAASVFFEWAYRKIMKLDSTVYDGSAVVTGLLIAMVCPVGLPYWALIIGDFFAIIVVKQLFGGIGKNFMNPALAARAFMLSWPALMTTWAASGSRTPIFQSTSAALDAVSSATPLSALHVGALPVSSVLDSFVGNIGGSMGETSALLLLVGGLYLLVRKVISPRIPLCFLGTVALLTFLFPQGNERLTWMLYQVCSGGLMLGAIFMATDYVTSPVTKKGQVLFAVGCGALTVFIRYFGSYPEGVSYAILVMNACVVLLDKLGIPKRFGVPTKGGNQA